MDHGKFKKKQKELDVCAGTGTLILNLMSKSYFSYFEQCTAIDINEGAIDRLKERIDELNLTDTCSAECRNIMDTSFTDNEFDAVVGNSFLHHLPNNKAFLEEMHRIVKKGGSICFTGEPTVSCSGFEGLFLGNLRRKV